MYLYDHAHITRCCLNFVVVVLSSSFSHYVLLLIALSRCKFHKMVFFNAFSNFHKNTVLTVLLILTQKSQGIQVVRTFCSFNAKAGAVLSFFISRF